MKCPKCRSINIDTAHFCSNCATPLSSSKEIPLTETLETPKEELTTGSTFAGRYQIIEALGKGGMGKVYKVHDTDIKDKVALKLLNPEIAADKRTIERFRNEIKLARKIVHKNVGRMYDLGREQDTYYISMEYVPGEDLKSFIRRSGQLAVGTTIRIAKEICEGLLEAHRLGVVHRDLKPSNIMIDKEGNARIMDFGIARSITGKGITDAGVMIGTPEYMSPEQAEVKAVDQRSDIYSLGVILYEMVTGRVPFGGETPLGIAMKHKSEMPKDPMEINAQIPEDLSRLILRCLEKDKEKRYQSAGELRSELENIEKGIPTTERETPKRKPITSRDITVQFSLKKLFIPVLGIIALAIAIVIIWQLLPREDVIPSEPVKPSVAVLPFIDLSPQKDQEYFCDGMTDEIIARLSTFKGWKVIPRTSMMRYKNTDKNLNEIAQELDVTTILEGSIRKEGDDIRVNSKLIKIEDSTSLWSDTYEEKLESVFAIQSDVSEQIANALRVELSPEEIDRLERKPTENLEAYNLYLKGRWFWNKRTEEGFRKGIEYFEPAVEQDPSYALAFSGLADCYNLLGTYSYLSPKEAFFKAKELAKKALQIDDKLTEAHASLAYAVRRYEFDLEKSEMEYKRALELNPEYATAHHWYSFDLLILGRFNEAIDEIHKALKLDPVSPIINVDSGRILYFSRMYDRALEQCLKAVEMFPDFWKAHFVLGEIYIQKEMYEDAIIRFKRAKELSYNPWAIANLGYMYAVLGNRDKALNILDELKKLSERMYNPPTFEALIHVGLGNYNKAFELLEIAVEERGGNIVLIDVEPRFNSIRSDPRFKALLKKMNLK